MLGLIAAGYAAFLLIVVLVKAFTDVIEGRTVAGEVHRQRRFTGRSVYNANARDTATGIEAKAENVDNAEDARKQAVENLFDTLRRRGLVKDPNTPDATTSESEMSFGQESGSNIPGDQPAGDVDPQDEEPIPKKPVHEVPEPEPDQNQNAAPGEENAWLRGRILLAIGTSQPIKGFRQSSRYSRDEGRFEIEGFYVVYWADIRQFPEPAVYDAVARDTASGIEATAEDFDNSEDAYLRAVANLFVILRQRGLMKDPSAPDATAPKSNSSAGQESGSKPAYFPGSDPPEPAPKFPEPEPDQNQDVVPGADEKLLPSGDQHEQKPRSWTDWSLAIIIIAAVLHKCFQFLPAAIIPRGVISGVLRTGLNIFTTVISTDMFFVFLIITLHFTTLINMPRFVDFVLKLVKSPPKSKTFEQTADKVLEVLPDYQGSYAAHRMKPAEPTPDMLAPRDTYNLWSPCKGIAFILNNTTFESGQREGSDIDLENMVHLFKELGYEVNQYTDKKGKEIKDLIRSFAAMFNQEGAPYDSAVVVLMSHGDRGVILGTDGVRVNPRNLRRELEGDRCPGLKGKPKMFFVQACRGNENMTAPRPVVSDGPSSQLTGGERYLPVQPDNEIASNIQDKADVHFAYASIEGSLSLRSEAIGSFFVQALCEVFFANAHRDNLDTLMNKVTRRVIRMKGKLYDHESSQWILINQTPEIIKSMCKDLYFLPKYSKTK